MANIGKGISITGTVEAGEPLSIAGSIKGEIHIGDHEVVLEAEARIDGAIMARTIEVRGQVLGRLVAKDAVRLRAGSVVQGDIATPRLSLEEGAIFNGRVDPGRTEAAFKVAEHRTKAATG